MLPPLVATPPPVWFVRLPLLQAFAFLRALPPLASPPPQAFCFQPLAQHTVGQLKPLLLARLSALPRHPPRRLQLTPRVSGGIREREASATKQAPCGKRRQRSRLQERGVGWDLNEGREQGAMQEGSRLTNLQMAQRPAPSLPSPWTAAGHSQALPRSGRRRGWPCHRRRPLCLLRSQSLSSHVHLINTTPQTPTATFKLTFHTKRFSQLQRLVFLIVFVFFLPRQTQRLVFVASYACSRPEYRFRKRQQHAHLPPGGALH